MTREEAIKIIDCYDIGFYDLSGEKIPADKLAEAFDMAIEALQTDLVPCKDCRFWKNEHLCLVMSRYGSIDTKAEHYCSWGERRDQWQHFG